jgi:hypothetical protein
VWEKPQVGLYAPLSQPLPIDTPPTKRSRAAHDTKARKAHGKQQREWDAARNAKADPSASGAYAAPRKQRIDAGKPRAASRDRFERAVALGVELLIGDPTSNEAPIWRGKQLHDFNRASRRPFMRAISDRMKQEYGDRDEISPEIAEEAERLWLAEVTAGRAPNGVITSDAAAAFAADIADEVEYPGDMEGYRTRTLYVDDFAPDHDDYPTDALDMFADPNSEDEADGTL